jgi:phosphoribosylglycinamide formyltransferase-1
LVNPSKPLNLVVLGSGSGTNLEAILSAQKNNLTFRVKAVVVDRKCRCIEIAKKNNIPLIFLPFKQLFKNKKIQSSFDYFSLVVKQLSLLEKEYRFTTDLVVLAGFMRIVTNPFLEKFHCKIINVHPADLTELDENAKRKFIGANSVFDALKSGKRKTRSTVIFINEGIDSGPILVSGPWVAYEGVDPITEQSVQKHQEKQKKLSDHVALVFAIKLISQKRVRFKNQKLFVDENIVSKAGLEIN